MRGCAVSRIGETFACARCGEPVVRTTMRKKYCRACSDATRKEARRKWGETHPYKIAETASRRRWAKRRAAERVEAMLRRERLLSEIGRDRPSRVYVWRDCVVEWRGTAPSF